MTLLAMSLGLRFCASKKGETGGGGWVSTLSPGNMASCGLSCRKPYGRHWVGHFSPLCMNGLREWSSGHVGLPFLAVRLVFSQPVRVTIQAKSCDYCELVRQWVRFASHECGCNGTCMKLEASKPI